MRTIFRIALFCLPVMLAVTGCVGGASGKTAEKRRKITLKRKHRIDDALRELTDVFEIRWDNVEVNDDEYLRTVQSIDVGDKCLFVTTSDGLLFILNATRGCRRAAYMPGSSQPIQPPVVQGSYMGARFIYLVQDNKIHAIDRPGEREGLLTPAWVVRHDGIIATPLCETEDYLFFGSRDQRAYAVAKYPSEGRNDIRFIDRLGSRMKAAPAAMDRINRPFFMDVSGSLYQFGGRFRAILKPLQENLGSIDIPILIDEPSATLLAASANYKVYAINANAARMIMWTGELGSKPVGSMYIYDRAVYVVNEDGELRAFHLDATDSSIAGEPLWEGQPVLDVKSVISRGEENTLYVLRTGNRIGKLDTASGKIVWERELPEFDCIPVNHHDSSIYLAIKGGWLWALKPR